MTVSETPHDRFPSQEDLTTQVNTRANVDNAYVPGDRSSESTLSKSVAVDKNVEYNYDLSQAPRHKKMILLTVGKIGIMGKLYGDHRDDDILGWFPMPARNLQRETEILSKKAKKY